MGGAAEAAWPTDCEEERAGWSEGLPPPRLRRFLLVTLVKALKFSVDLLTFRPCPSSKESALFPTMTTLGPLSVLSWILEAEVGKVGVGVAVLSPGSPLDDVAASEDGLASRRPCLDEFFRLTLAFGCCCCCWDDVEGVAACSSVLSARVLLTWLLDFFFSEDPEPPAAFWPLGLDFSSPRSAKTLSRS